MAEPDRSAKEDSGSFRRAGFIAAAAFLVLVVAFAVTVVLGHGDRTSPPNVRRSSTPASAPPAASGCHPSDTSQQLPRQAPATTWTVFKSIAIPSSSSAGPMITDGQLAHCFAHTPVGALMASWQIYVRGFLGDEWRRVTTEQFMPGPGRDAFVKLRSTITGDTSDPGVYGQVAAFQFASYTSDTAVIEIVTRFTDGTMQVGNLTVVWSGGDWRLQLQPDGSPTATSEQVTSLDGFVPWGGV